MNTRDPLQREDILRIKYAQGGLATSQVNIAYRSDSKEVMFYPEREIATTSKNLLRVFKQENENQYIVVKSNLTKIAENKFKPNERNLLQELICECNFWMKAYPDLAAYLFTISETNSIYRLVIPHIQGFQLDSSAASILNQIEFLAFLLSIMNSLNQLHQKNIVHGDVTYYNALSYYDQANTKWIVHFVDFECAYDINGPVATTFFDAFYPGTMPKRWAPERSGDTIIQPAFNQDIYSLSYLLDELIGFAKQVQYSENNFQNTFPNLFTLFQKGLSLDPAERPLLTEIINVTESEIKMLGN